MIMKVFEAPMYIYIYIGGGICFLMLLSLVYERITYKNLMACAEHAQPVSLDCLFSLLELYMEEQ